MASKQYQSTSGGAPKQFFPSPPATIRNNSYPSPLTHRGGLPPLMSLIRGNNDSSWLVPPPAPPVFGFLLPRSNGPSTGSGDFDFLDTINVELPSNPRMGYLNSEAGLTRRNLKRNILTREFVQETRPPVIDENVYKELANRIKDALTPKMKTAEINNDLNTRNETLTFLEPTGTLEEQWDPYERMNLTLSLYPKKARVAVNQDSDQYSRYSAGDSNYIVQTSTKLVRNHTALIETPKTALISRSNMTWTRNNAVAEQSNSTETAVAPEPEPDVVIQMEETHDHFSSNSSPNCSPNRVIVVCEQETTTVSKNDSVTRTFPKKNAFDKGSMSFRVINGHRIAGDSKECHDYIKGSCMLGIFCKYEHNGSNAHSKVKVCHRLLRGLCRPDNKECSFEHDALLPHQYPNCVFFLRGDCTVGNKCTLLHVKHNNLPSPCPDFLRGNCLMGDECYFPHVYPWTITKEKGASFYQKFFSTFYAPTTKTDKLSVPRSRRVYFRQEEHHLTEGAQETEQLNEDPNEVIIGVDEVHEEIIEDEKLEHLARSEDDNGEAWRRDLANKRPYPEEDLDDDEVHHYNPAYHRLISEVPSPKEKLKKFSSGPGPIQYLSRMPDRVIDNQLHVLEYEDESGRHPCPSQQLQNSRLLSRLSVAPRIDTKTYNRGSTTVIGNFARHSQSAPVKSPSVGQAAHLAAQRLPQLGGGPPKENKPLKVVTLLPNSRRQGTGPPRPLVSSVRSLGKQVTNKVPQLSIEKQAELIISQSVKQGDCMIEGGTIGEFNKIIETLNEQITSLQDDNKRLNSIYTGLIEFKDNRIKHLEDQLEKMNEKILNLSKTWQAHLIQKTIQKPVPDVKERNRNSVQIHRPTTPRHQLPNDAFHNRRQRLSQVTAEEWIIANGALEGNANSEIHQEIIEEEVDEETFLRMQNELPGEMVLHHDVEVPGAETTTSTDGGSH